MSSSAMTRRKRAAAPKTPGTRARMGDYVYTLRKARKYHRCEVCRGDIDPGMQYYAATIGGGGLGSLKYPTYLHFQCKEEHQKSKEGRNGNQH